MAEISAARSERATQTHRTRPQVYLVPDPVRREPAAPTSGWYVTWGKRTFDIVVSGALLLVLSPVLLASWLALRLSLGPGVILKQRRVGENGLDFEMYKFRTMLPDKRQTSVPFDGIDRRQTHKSDEDPRHTGIGRLMRRLSIDELPQLVNIFMGDMSLVGPRPELSQIADRHGLRDHPRHQVRPGLTGVWQTSVRSTGALLHETVDADLIYFDDISLRGDLVLMAKTVTAFTGGR